MAALAFSSGGYFPGPPALAAVVLTLLLVLRITVARRPVAGLSALYVTGAVLLGLLAVWTLLSATWSGSPARAQIEFDRTLLYLLAFVLGGVVARTDDRVRWLVRGLGVGILVVCVSGFITRTLPDVWPIPEEYASARLSYPTTYYNSLGLLAALGLIVGFGLSADRREHPAVRVVAAAALPVLAVTLLFTFSRGAMIVGAAGLVAVLLLGRSWTALSALVAAVPAAVAARTAYAADLLTSDRPTTAAATAEGHDVAVAVALCTVGAIAIRLVLLALDRASDRIATPAPLRRPAVKVAGLAVALVVAAGGAVAAGAPDAISRQYERSVTKDQVTDSGDLRKRLTDPGNAGRVSQWRVAMRESRSERFHGTGAGTYALLWDRGRGEEYEEEFVYQVEDAHSLFVEMLAELGVVGLALLVAFLLLALSMFALRARGPERGVYATLFAAALAWALHAAIDWDWEMPAVTVWLFGAAGLVLAARPPADEPGGQGPPRILRVVVALGLLLVAILPARMYLSEGPLRDARRALAASDCVTAVDRSLDALEMAPARPEPFEIVGFCDIRLRQPELAVRAMQNAIDRDPNNWEFHYAMALVRGATGQDPRAAVQRALRLNPMSDMVREAAEQFATDDPAKWRSRALAAPLPRDD